VLRTKWLVALLTQAVHSRNVELLVEVQAGNLVLFSGTSLFVGRHCYSSPCNPPYTLIINLLIKQKQVPKQRCGLQHIFQSLFLPPTAAFFQIWDSYTTATSLYLLTLSTQP
jgi:hypothetical protein